MPRMFWNLIVVAAFAVTGCNASQESKQTGAEVAKEPPASIEGSQEPPAATATPDNPADVEAIKKINGVLEYDAENHVTGVDLNNQPATDEDLVHLEGLPHLVRLELWGAEITDRGIKKVVKLSGLKNLGLENTEITDAGVGMLPELTSLKSLSLRRSTAVTNNGLAP